LRLVRHLDDLDAPVGPLPHALLLLLAEADRRAVLEVDAIRLVLADEIECTVVVDVAVLEDLDERTAAMRRGGAQHARQVRAVGRPVAIAGARPWIECIP